MNLFFTLNTALRSLKARKGRSFLTMLGILIGIATVILVMSVGAGAQSLIFNEINKVGSNLIGVMPGGGGEEGPPAALQGIIVTTLKYEDAIAMNNPRNMPYLIGVTAYAKGSATITYKNKKTDTFFNGTMAGYPNVEDVKIDIGQYFSKQDEKKIAKVTILGSAVKKELFGDENPLGKSIKIKRESFKVIGVLEKRGSAGFQNKDDQVFIPITTAQKILLGIHHISLIRAKVDNPRHIDASMEQAKELLRRRHNIKDPEDDDFTVLSQKKALSILNQVTYILTFFLVAIAAISLIVGGIGIMNIMLVNVTERTREIGLRKALGAKKRNILRQFLIEAIVITLFGGCLGIIFGSVMSASIALIVQYLGYNWTFSISSQSILLGVSVSSIVGLVFGYYPARKAAKLPAIEALRYE